MEIIDQVKQFIARLITCLQMARLYSVEHRIFRESVSEAFQGLQLILQTKSELILGVVNGELAFEREIFFELSGLELARKIISFLQERGVERITFASATTEMELRQFVALLVQNPRDRQAMNMQEVLAIAGVRNISAGKILADLQTPQQILDEKRGSQGAYGQFSQRARLFLDSCIHGGPTDFPEFKSAAFLFLDALDQRPQEFVRIALSNVDASLPFAHAVHTAVLSVFFASKLQLNRGDMLDILIAGLLHDAGRLGAWGEDCIPAGTLSHTARGARLLLAISETVGFLPALVAWEHHARFDKTGFWRLPPGCAMHLSAQIVALCDAYDLLIQRRSERNGYLPEQIYAGFSKRQGTRFSPELTEAFFRVLGIWPVGSVVELTDGRIAVVRQQNEDAPRLPQVQIVSAAGAGESVDLKQSAMPGLSIKRGLNPLTEAAAYLRVL